MKQPTFAVPWGIGCGMAGGDWDEYARIIDAWADAVDRKMDGKVFIYKLW